MYTIFKVCKIKFYATSIIRKKKKIKKKKMPN